MNLFTLYATLGLNADNFEKGVDKASRQGKGLASSLNDSVGGAAKAVGQKTSAMTIAMGTALYDLGKTTVKAAASFGKSIISEYADTEQMVDGVKTLFKNDASTVLANANNAFKTAGLSANEYMDTVTSFSASLLSGLGGDTAKAAEIADMAVQDMSDNANKFGTDMASIQNAYQGFAKQNYTMLDNLKLGYGGTKSEMQRLLKDARKIQKANGVNVKYSINNFNDIIEAIHVIQDEMGITGTTEAEAMDTISGSFNAFKASWKNWLSGLANDESDVSQLTDDLVESGKIALDNIKKHIPTIVANVTTALSELGTEALNAGANLLVNLYAGLTGDETSPEEIKAYIGGVFGDVQTKINTVVDTGKSFFSGFLKGLNDEPGVETNIVNKVGGLFDNFFAAKDSFIELGGTILGSFYEKISGQEATAENIGNTIGGVFSSAVTFAGDLLGAGDTFMRELNDAIQSDPQSKQEAIDYIAGVATATTDGLAQAVDGSKKFLSNLYYAITSDTEGAEKIKNLFDAESTSHSLTEGAKKYADVVTGRAEEPSGDTVRQGMILAAKAIIGNNNIVTNSELRTSFLAGLANALTGTDVGTRYFDEGGAEEFWGGIWDSAVEVWQGAVDIWDSTGIPMSGTGGKRRAGVASPIDLSAIEAGNDESATRLEQAAQTLIDAAAALASSLLGVEVNLDGEKVGELTSEYVKRDVVREMKIQFPNLAWGR